MKTAFAQGFAFVDFTGLATFEGQDISHEGNDSGNGSNFVAGCRFNYRYTGPIPGATAQQHFDRTCNIRP